LLAVLARAPGPGLGGPRAGVAELAEDLAELVVDGLQHRRVLIEGQFPEPVQACHGLVDAGVPRGLRGLRWHPRRHFGRRSG
jgi:hypothetical protein